MKKPPEKIYLQQFEDGWSEHGVTWCKDKINEHDVEYIRKDQMADMIDALLTIKTTYREPDTGNMVINNSKWLKIEQALKKAGYNE